MEMIGLEHFSNRQDPCQREAINLRLLGRLGPGARQEPRVKRAVDHLTRLGSGEGLWVLKRPTEIIIIDQIDQLGELLNHRDDCDIAVGTGVDAHGNKGLPVSDGLRSRLMFGVFIAQQGGRTKWHCGQRLDRRAVNPRADPR